MLAPSQAFGGAGGRCRDQTGRTQTDHAVGEEMVQATNGANAPAAKVEVVGKTAGREVVWVRIPPRPPESTFRRHERVLLSDPAPMIESSDSIGVMLDGLATCAVAIHAGRTARCRPRVFLGSPGLGMPRTLDIGRWWIRDRSAAHTRARSRHHALHRTRLEHRKLGWCAALIGDSAFGGTRGGLALHQHPEAEASSDCDRAA